MLFALLIAAAGLWFFSLLRATSLIYSLSPVRPPLAVRAYMKFFRHPTGQTDFTVQGKNGPVPVRMVFPVDAPNAPMVVLVHGLAPDGNKDGLLNFVAFHMAEIGLRVVMPDIPGEQHRLMRASDLDDVGATIQWSAAASKQRVALFGISFGGGLAIATAEMPQYSNLVKVVFSDAGYNDIERLGRYYIGERVFGPDGRPYDESRPGSGPLLMAFQHLDEMVPADDVPAMKQLILSEALDHSGGPAPPKVLTPAQNQIYDDLRAVKNADIETPTVSSAARAASGRDGSDLSGSRFTRRLPRRLICRGLDDNTIPPKNLVDIARCTARSEGARSDHIVDDARCSVGTSLDVAEASGGNLRAPGFQCYVSSGSGVTAAAGRRENWACDILNLSLRRNIHRRILGRSAARSGLKIRREQSHGGSSPPPGTIENKRVIVDFAFRRKPLPILSDPLGFSVPWDGSPRSSTLLNGLESSVAWCISSQRVRNTTTRLTECYPFP